MNLTKFTVFIALFMPLVICGQNASLKEGKKSFDNLAYIDAINVYQDVVNNGYENEEILKNLGDSYYFVADYINAAKWYARLFKYSAVQDNQYNFRYGHSLRAFNDYQKADDYLRRYYEISGYEYTSSEAFLSDLELRTQRFITLGTAYSSEYSDYPAFMRGDSLYVVSANKQGIMTAWNNEPSSDIYLLENEFLKELKGDVNTKYNEGSIAVTKDGNTMYFTRNNYQNNKVGKDVNKTVRLKLYSATKVNGSWTNISELPFNNSEYSVGHPALSIDDSYLYFVSDMKVNGNKGGTDIYRVRREVDGGYGEIENVAEINTLGNEMFPYISDDGSFYFASNGQAVNLGGLDIYQVLFSNDGSFQEIVNLGAPVNSRMDDFAFMYNDSNEKGYFATNREGHLKDDILVVAENKEFVDACSLNVFGTVRDANSNDLLGESLITFIGHENETIDYKSVSEVGTFKLDDLNCNKIKSVRFEKAGYFTQELDLPEITPNLDVLLMPRNMNLQVGDDLARLIRPVYFDIDKFNITKEAEIELQKIVSILKNNPSLKLDVRSHTDSRAGANYNLILSHQRARSTINYLVKAGINPDRLSGRGYGESQTTNGCIDGVECSEEEHNRNRRSEFIILEL